MSYNENIKAVLGKLADILTQDRPQTHGSFAGFAETFAELHTAYMAGIARSGRAPTPLDSYAVQVIQKLARIANGDPEKSQDHFVDIAGYGIGGAAHVMTALDNKRNADCEREEAAFAAGKTHPSTPDYVVDEGSTIPGDLTPGTQVYMHSRQRIGDMRRRIGYIGNSGRFIPAEGYAAPAPAREPHHFTAATPTMKHVDPSLRHPVSDHQDIAPSPEDRRVTS